MQQIDVLLTSDLTGGSEPFHHGDLKIVFHRWSEMSSLPLVEGTLCAFVDWLPRDITGLEVCRRLRCNPLSAKARITMVLDHDDVEGKRQAMRAGADDFIVGPIDRRTVLDRLLSIRFGESEMSRQNILREGDLEVDLAAFQARWKGRPIRLMPNEFRLLRYFIEHPGRVFTRAQLITALGKQDPPIDERTVDVWVGRLRRALRAEGAGGSRLRTVRMLGYVLDRT
jgi:two-component system, OmpR family, phosphate regulon response regulator PhoB